MTERYKIGDLIECRRSDEGSPWQPGVVISADYNQENIAVELVTGRRYAVDLYYGGHLIRPRSIIDVVGDLAS